MSDHTTRKRATAEICRYRGVECYSTGSYSQPCSIYAPPLCSFNKRAGWTYVILTFESKVKGGNNMTLKDARSVSLYPYNRSQILQYVEYTKFIN